jgi:hypothetical protein
MRRLHLTFGLLGVLVFVLTGQIMRHHTPAMHELAPDVHMMFISRHIYLLTASVLNLVLGIYFRPFAAGWRRATQWVGSVLFVASPILLTIAFFQEPAYGLAGRSWRNSYALFAMLGGGLLQLLSFFREEDGR